MSSSSALPPMNAPGALDVPVGVQPGAQQKVFRTLIIFGTGAGVGWFEYGGTPGLGNGPVSYAAPPGTTQDPFGNALPWTAGGVVATDPITGNFVVMTAATVQWGVAGLASNGSIGFGAHDLNINAPQSFGDAVAGSLDLRSGASAQAFIAGRATVGTIVNTQLPGTPETPHSTAAGLPAGVTGAVNYWFLPLLENAVWLDFQLTIAAGTTLTAGVTTLSALTGLYIPANTKIFNFTLNQFGVAAWTVVPIQMDTGGTFTYRGPTVTVPAGGNSFLFGQAQYQTTF